MEGLYIRKGFPEYQEFQEKEGFKEHSCYCADTDEYFIEQDWAFRNHEDDENNEHIKNVMVLIRKEVDPVDCERALGVIDEYRCPLYHADEVLYDKIRSCLEEYGKDNGLEDEWWEKYEDIDDIFFKL